MNGPNGPYEKEQGRLMQLYHDLSDDDEEQDPYHDSDASDPDFVPSETSDTDEPVVGLRRFPSEEFLINLSSSDLENDYQSPPLSDAEPEDLDLHRDDDGDRTIPEEPDLWEDTTKPIPIFDFDEDSVGLNINIDENSSPLEVFTSLFTPQIWEYLVQCSNNYAVFLTSTNRPKTRNCRTATIRPITVDELKAFFGLCLLQGQVSTYNVRRFFSFKYDLYYHPVFPFVMSARRFEQILRILCASAPNLKGKMKVETLIDMFRFQFQAAYVPTNELSFNESLLHFRGRLGFRVYIKNKKDRYGIKFYRLATSDGYVLNLEMYSGRDAKNNGGNQGGGNSTTENLVLRLMEPYLQKGYELFMDNYYNSVTLPEKLLELKTHSNGKVYTVINKRHGKVLEAVGMDEKEKLFLVQAQIPVIESEGFASEIRKTTSGQANPSLRFSHYEVIDGDPFFEPVEDEDDSDDEYEAKMEYGLRANKLRRDVRRRKGLQVEDEVVVHAEKQRTLNKKK